MRAYYDYLDELRETGQTNMLGSVPYLMDEFDLSRHEARAILTAWIEKH